MDDGFGGIIWRYWLVCITFVATISDSHEAESNLDNDGGCGTHGGCTTGLVGWRQEFAPSE